MALKVSQLWETIIPVNKLIAMPVCEELNRKSIIATARFAPFPVSTGRFASSGCLPFSPVESRRSQAIQLTRCLPYLNNHFLPLSIVVEDTNLFTYGLRSRAPDNCYQSRLPVRPALFQRETALCNRCLCPGCAFARNHGNQSLQDDS